MSAPAVSVTYNLRRALRQRRRRPHVNIHARHAHNNDAAEDMHRPAVCKKTPSTALHRASVAALVAMATAEHKGGNDEAGPPF